MEKISLSNNELEIMNLLWKEDRPLSRSEIIELSPDRSWQKSSIHILLNKLLDKGAIDIAGFVRTNKNYGRTYKPVITQEDYVLTSVKASNSALKDLFKVSTNPSVFAALLNDADVDEDVLNRLEQMIEERRKELH